MSLGPTTNIFGVRPLKKEPSPSLAIILETIAKPVSASAEDLAWMRVLMTSSCGQGL